MTAAWIGVAALLAAGQSGAPEKLPRMLGPEAVCPTVMMAADAIGEPVTAASVAARAPALAIGARSRVTLAPAASVRFAVAPAHKPAAGSYGGVVAFAVDRPGRYRIGIGGPAWIDVVRGTATIASVAHAHGDRCSPIRKTVDFDLKPGRHLVQLSGSTAPSPWVSVTRLP